MRFPPLSDEDKEKYRIKAYAVGQDGSRKPIEADQIDLEMENGKWISVLLTSFPNKQALPLATGAIASRNDNDSSYFSILPSCSNVVYLNVMSDDPE